MNSPEFEKEHKEYLENHRTGKHKCIKCIKEIPLEEFLKNDHICDECSDKLEYPQTERCVCKHAVHTGRTCNEQMTRGEIIHHCNCGGTL